ncbi:MAG: hypothetical protein Q7T04_05045 [Dehalococcoidia bacterium]|nr:hypothetical protein [Dehalococcoidia bacterium]
MASVELEMPVRGLGIPLPGTGATDGCCHYWVIGSPAGPSSAGTCKFCGTRRDFTNSVPIKEYHRRPEKPSESAADIRTRGPVLSAVPDIVDLS